MSCVIFGAGKIARGFIGHLLYLNNIDFTFVEKVDALSDLINEKETAKEICRAFDSVSISLNDVSSEAYDKITRNIYPGKAYEAMLKFAKDCVNEGVETRLSVVDVIGEEKIKKAKEIADSIGADFLCRKYDN